MTAVTVAAGTRWGAFVSLAGATLAASGTGLAQNLAGLMPAAMRAVREWFPARLRPLAIGLFLAPGPLVYAVASPALAAAVLCLLLRPARQSREPSRGVSGEAKASAAMLWLGPWLAAPVAWVLTSLLPEYAAWMEFPQAARLFAVAGACGAVLAGAIAWAMMSRGVGAARTRAVLLTVCGAIPPLVVFCNWTLLRPLLPIAVCGMAYPGWCALMYSAVADSLPARGAVIGAGVVDPLKVGATAATALLVVALLAWLARSEPQAGG
jgi:hypothetical protein